MTKIFRSRESNDPLPHVIGTMFGLRFSQGGYYISAENKAQALALADEAHMYVNQRSIQLAKDGDPYLTALRVQGGLLAFPGMIVASPSGDKRYAVWTDSPKYLVNGRTEQHIPARTWVHIGTSDYDQKTYQVTYTPEEI
jgi:hypothetical protein